MKSGLYGQRLSLTEELKAATFTAHARLQTAPFFEALAACRLPLESYVGQLRALAIVHGVLERALAASRDERVAAVWSPAMRKLPRLQRDLRFFEPRAIPDLREASDVATDIAEELRLQTLDRPLDLLGALYVLEGATLGAQALRPLYARAFLLDGGQGLAYLGAYEGSARSHWAEFRRRMDALILKESEREQVGLAAAGLFARFESLYRSLYPVRAASRTFLATSINPEAGRHPVPDDERELRAALNAADDCWARFPYLEARYGERGRRFARSDAAWLATLYAYESGQILQQVRWLGRVLAGRGMPTLILQDQLRSLAGELSAAVPEREVEYDRLTQAAEDLVQSRRRHLDDDQVEALARDFEQRAGADPGGLSLAGELMCCAVADELGGAEKAVESLCAWLLDPGRFSPAWIDAGEQTLREARARARTPQSEGARK